MKKTKVCSAFKWTIMTVVLCLFNNIQAQGEQPTITSFSINSNIQSPNSASLGTYGAIPVSLYSGTAEVSIPIYQINEGNIPLDINLQHDASGVRVNSVPGWVGQNWSLQAGGLIQRSVKGRSADEFDVTRGNNNYNNLFPHFNYWDDYGNDCNNDYCSTILWPWWNQGYKYNMPILQRSNWSSAQNLYSIYLDSRKTYNPPGWFDGDYEWRNASSNALDLKKYQPDLEPDIFSFNFMGHTGKFFLGQDGQWKVASSSNLKVICDFSSDVVSPVSTPEYNYNSPPYSTPHVFTEKYREFPRVINKITMIDDNGNQFVFGYNEATELTFPDFFNQQYSPIISSAWYLKYVKNKFGSIIYEFEYEKGPYIGHFYLSYNKFSILNTGFYDSTLRYDFKAPGQLILPIYLKKIKTKAGLSIEMNSSISNSMKFKENDNAAFTLGTLNNNIYPSTNYNRQTYINDTFLGPYYFYRKLLDFTTLNPEWNAANDYFSLLKWKKLDNIAIKDANANNLLTADFNYINQPDRRLFLTGLSINTEQKYIFEYDRDNLLPNFLSSAVDHLGYFDGTPFTIPLTETNWSGYYNQRLTNPEAVKYGSLKKITYPTKGFTEFVYEPHSYSKEIDKNGVLINSVSEGIIGGLRIKKIINNDGFGNNYVKEYQYTTGINSNISSGNLLFKPLYYVSNINTASILSVPKTAYIYDINQLIPMVNLFGNTIEYETIIEKESYFNSSTSINNSGYNIYKYSNYSQFPDLAPLNTTVPDYNFKFPRTDKSFERGKLLEKMVYDNLGNLKQKSSFKYESNLDLKANAINIVIVDASYESYGSYNFDSRNERAMGAYQIYYSDKYLTEKTVSMYTAAGEITKLNKYTYKNYPLSLGTIANNGDLFKNTEYEQTVDGGIMKTYKYPFDFSSSIYNNMYNSRIISPVNGKTEFVIGDSNSPTSRTAISEEQTNFTEIVNNIGGVTQVPQAVLFKKGSSSAFQETLKVLNYDNEGNVLEFKSKEGKSVCLIWGYNKTKMIAKIENVSYNDVLPFVSNLQNLSNTGTQSNLIIALNNLRASLLSSMVTTYTYIPLFGVTTITDPRGDIITYTYDSFGRLKFVKDAQGNLLSENQYHYKNQ
ncbi:RHS repeat domain-containing protein [Flavobacterium sp. MC2016-06]|uniref:RHS repeat domain-containing protein n=1 Tax=Flavobacterium sp. MC2016-06 TaxID=2676308 RepID=UPI00209A79D6|nr:RHS repeat domain-containing protein [Flavobacterium sp. MC2016-06]